MKIIVIVIFAFSFNYPQTIEDLPKPVQNSIDSLINNYMPILKNHIQLISIQKNDLKEMFENDSIIIGKILPQYEVRFSFSNNILGIDNYNIELGFDEFGQLLIANIPHRINPIWVATLISNDTAIEFGKNYCSAKGYGIDSVEVEFNYNPNFDCFVWLVSVFETDKENTDNTYIRIIEMNAESSEFISENSEQIITVY